MMTDDPKRFYALGYCFLRGEDDVYRCHSLGLEIYGHYDVGRPLPFTVCRRVNGSEPQWMMKREFGRSEKMHRCGSRTKAARSGLAKLCGITKARKGE